MIRHSNIYGPYDKFDLEKSHVLGATISKVMNAEKEIIIWGRGNEIRDFLYISDLIKFVELAIRKQKKKYEIYNCGSEIGTKILDLAKLIIKITGKNIKIKKNVTAPTIKFNLVVDCKKAKKEIGWKSKVSLSEGIKKTLIWWKKINLNNFTYY